MRFILEKFNEAGLDIFVKKRDVKNGDDVIQWEYCVRHFIEKVCNKVYLKKNLDKKLRIFKRRYH